MTLNQKRACGWFSLGALIVYAIAALLTSCASDRRSWDPGYGGVKPDARVLGERADKP